MMGTPQLNLASHRMLEEKLHSALQKNLCILTLVYSPSTEFSDILKQGMFTKSNPNAFLHTAHFLLNIIDPVDFKNKFEWPLYEKRMETSFKNTFRTYLPQLNDKYMFINLPTVKVSFMVTPGGYHFTMMMLKLSELAMILVLKRNRKQVILHNNHDSFDQDHNKDTSFFDKTTILNQYDKVNSKLKYRISYRDSFFKEADTEALMIQNRNFVIKEKIVCLKENWKQYISNISDLTDLERKMLVNEPRQAITVFKRTLLKQLEKNEHFISLLLNKVNLYKDINHMSDVLLERIEKKHGLQFDQNLKQLCTLRKYVAENFIPHVVKIVKNNVLNFPLLLKCLRSVLTEMNVLRLQNNRNAVATLSIKNSCDNLKSTMNDFKELNKAVHNLQHELQRNLNKARVDFENKAAKEDSPITSIPFYWPESSPYRELKLQTIYNKEITIRSVGVNRSASMFDISKLSNNSKNKSNVLQPTWFNMNMMSVRKPKAKSLNKINQRYQSSPCLNSPPTKVARLREVNMICKISPNKINYSTDITPTCSIHQNVSLIQQEKNLSINSENYITPGKSRKSIAPKFKNIVKRLSYVADEMPVPTLNSLLDHTNCSSSINNIQSPLENKPIKSKLLFEDNIDTEILSDCLSSPFFDNQYLESLMNSCDKNASKRISFGKFSMSDSENLNNISIPNEFNYSLDSD